MSLFAGRGQLGWRDLLQALFLEVTKITKEDEILYIRSMEKSFRWTSQSTTKQGVLHVRYLKGY